MSQVTKLEASMVTLMTAANPDATSFMIHSSTMDTRGLNILKAVSHNFVRVCF